MACSPNSSNFYLPPRYGTPNLDINVSINMANLNMINILALDFCIWQHFGNNRSETHMINSTQPIMPFDMDNESTEHTNSIWTLFSHTGMYVTAIGLLIPAGLGLFCCYFFWCQPARLAHQPLQPGNMQHTIVDDNVEEAPFYRCNGKVLPPTKSHDNHGMAIEHLPTWTESQCKQQSKSLVVPVHGSLEKSSKIQRTQKCM